MNFADAIALVRSGTDFLVTCHRRPDADALGSALGLARILKRIGKRATVFVPETLPLNLRFLPAPGEIVLVLPDDARFDATFVTDTAAASLLPVGLPPREVRGPLVVVDHHAAHDDVGDVIVRDVKACATGEIVVRIADELGAGSFDESIAQPLYAAIVADTGGSAIRSPQPPRCGSAPASSRPGRIPGWSPTTSSRAGRPSGCVCSAWCSTRSRPSSTGSWRSSG